MATQKSLMNESNNIQQMLNSFDFATIDEMDPSLADGHRVVYDREIPFHIRFQKQDVETEDLPNLEPLRTRVFILGDEKNLQQLKLELSSDNDIFFHFTHLANENNFKTIKQTQQLNIQFNEYPSICIKCFNKVEKDQNQYSAIFTIMNEGMGRLEIVQSTEYKNIEVIAFEFQASNDDLIRQIITFRYMSLKSKLALMEGRLQDINEVVRVKNPSLLLQIQKTMPGQNNRSTIKK
ncbi:hypothetical protein IMG5_160400 [Ichthyophthirius multifiliis]|uniref:Spindle assembly abnormal protein 6 N-terminal domain-containing protein n=1 Tax=Ichthyophthirius multifiliis TaxID=5932 RepID=G0QZX9_ICHMU|nr:hypothetical protein IMG5_160400 [Ichthyophthirius multifiliis]EGR29241.1 hypothetical protein IMG5_160400 [Ichthyophthirius multifiliis]|eukprot:XP_004030477.1 hypothetical protein IMG5_160400 [Ichthyophthirius multifiliis]